MLSTTSSPPCDRPDGTMEIETIALPVGTAMSYKVSCNDILNAGGSWGWEGG